MTYIIKRLSIILTLVLMMSSCTGGEITKRVDLKDDQVAIYTNHGTIVVKMHKDQTPNTVKSFVDLALSDFYDGVIFHRVIPGFMIQGGDPTGTGTGGPGYKFADEIVPELHNIKGTLSMANAGPKTNGSQFFINVNDNNFLDGKHAVFGKVQEGLDVAVAISGVARNRVDRPDEDVVMIDVDVAENLKEWTKSTEWTIEKIDM